MSSTFVACLKDGFAVIPSCQENKSDDVKLRHDPKVMAVRHYWCDRIES